MQDFLIVFVIFATLFGITYLFFTTRHRERIALIDKMEKGADASIFKTGTKLRWSLFALFFGMLSVAVSLGVITGAWLNTSVGIAEEIAFPSMIFLFGGACLILYYL